MTKQSSKIQHTSKFLPIHKQISDNITLDIKTDSTNYGKYVKHDLNHNDIAWARCERFPNRGTPMTKFVEDMYLTNREFSLF